MAFKLKYGMNPFKGDSMEWRVGLHRPYRNIVAVDGYVMAVHLGSEKQPYIEIVGRCWPLLVLPVYCVDDFLGNHNFRVW